MANDGAVIIKKVKKGGHGGHHGGAWKVAYADFVTAMMAFFLLMWLINTTTPEQKRGIADYFAAQSISQTTSGAGGVLGGMVLGPKGARAAGSMSIDQKQTPPAPSEQTRTKDKAKSQGGNTAAEGKAPASQVQSDNHMQRAVPSAESEEFESAAESIRQAMQAMPDIAALSRQVITDQTPQGPAHPAGRSGRPPDVPGRNRGAHALCPEDAGGRGQGDRPPAQPHRRSAAIPTAGPSTARTA